MQSIQRIGSGNTLNFEAPFYQQPKSIAEEPQPHPPRAQLWHPTTWRHWCHARREIPVYFDPNGYRNIQAFRNSLDFIRFRHQFNRAIDDILECHAASQLGNQPVEDDLNTFRRNVFSDYYADHMAMLYSEGKKLVETIARELKSNRLPVDRQLDIIRAMAPGLVGCSGGAMSNLQDAVTQLTRAEDSLLAFVLASKHDMVDAAVLDFIRSRHTYFAGNEIHYVNAYRAWLDDIWGLPRRSDAFASIADLSDDDVLDCIHHVDATVTPKHLLDHLAESFMQDMQALFADVFRECPMPLSFDRPEDTRRYQSFLEKLDAYDKTHGARFGGLPPLNSFLTLDSSGNLLGLKPQSTLVKLEFLHRMHGAGLIREIPEAELVGQPSGQKQLMHLPRLNLIWSQAPTGPEPVDLSCLAGLASTDLDTSLRQQILSEVMQTEPTEDLCAVSPDWLADLPAKGIRDAFFKRLGPDLLRAYVARHSPLREEIAISLLSHATACYPNSGRPLLLELLEMIEKPDRPGSSIPGRKLMKIMSKAIAANDLGMAEKIARTGMDINSPGPFPPGHTPLIDAVLHGTPEMVARLLALGARIDASSVFHACPIEYAVGAASADVLRILLKNAPPAHLRKKCAFADSMIMNCVDDCEGKVPLLLEYLPLDFCAVDEENDTFLMKILRNFPPSKLLKALVDHPLVRPSVNIRNRDGKTVLDFANRFRFLMNLAEVLREAGAVPGTAE